MAMIELRNIRKVFNTGKPNEFVALDGVSLGIASQNITVLKGPSGSGKTTLLSILGCMARPTSGRVMLGERELTSLPERFLTEIRRRTFGFVFQQVHLIKGISTIENVVVPALPGGEKYASLKSRAMDLLNLLNVSGKAYEKVDCLSGGEAQRVAIARALINNPSIIIADEPTAHLDTKLSAEFMEIVESLKTEGKTIIIASHDPVVYDSSITDCVVALRDGKIENTATI